MPIGGVDLITRTVNAALGCDVLDEVCISTDSDEYAGIAAAAGLETDYRRPASLNRPDTSTVDAVLHYLDWRIENDLPDASHVLVLQPTSPQRGPDQINRAIRHWRRTGRPSMISVMPAGPSAGYVVVEDAETKALSSGKDITQGEFYILDGMFFLAPVDMLREDKLFWNSESALYISTYPRPHDIDTANDFAAARCMIEHSAFGMIEDASNEPVR